MNEKYDLNCAYNSPVQYTDDVAFAGQSLKYLINIESNGFSMDDDNWFVIVRVASGQEITLNKSDLAHEGDQWYICFTTGSDWRGPIYAEITAEVPDSSFSGGERVEKFKRYLITVVQ